jgi:hypothetical protein
VGQALQAEEEIRDGERGAGREAGGEFGEGLSAGEGTVQHVHGGGGWFVSAVRLPNFALPALVQIVGAVFPLTGSLVAVRGALIENHTLTDLAPTLAALAALSALLVAAAAVILRAGEARSQRTGRLSLA